MRSRYKFLLIGYVVMPEHVHLLMKLTLTRTRKTGVCGTQIRLEIYLLFSPRPSLCHPRRETRKDEIKARKSKRRSSSQVQFFSNQGWQAGLQQFLGRVELAVFAGVVEGGIGVGALLALVDFAGVEGLGIDERPRRNSDAWGNPAGFLIK